MVTGWQRHSAFDMPQYEKKSDSAVNEKKKVNKVTQMNCCDVCGHQPQAPTQSAAAPAGSYYD